MSTHRNGNHKGVCQQVSGVKDRPAETFLDVKRALTEYLRRTDPVFLKISDEGIRRQAEIKSRKNKS